MIGWISVYHISCLYVSSTFCIVYVDANIVGLVKSLLQRCVGGQLVQDPFAMLVG